MVKHLQYFGSIAAKGPSDTDTDFESKTDTIAGEATSDSEGELASSTNIDVVGLAVFKGDILVRRAYC